MTLELEPVSVLMGIILMLIRKAFKDLFVWVILQNLVSKDLESLRDKCKPKNYKKR